MATLKSHMTATECNKEIVHMIPDCAVLYTRPTGKEAQLTLRQNYLQEYINTCKVSKLTLFDQFTTESNYSILDIMFYFLILDIKKSLSYKLVFLNVHIVYIKFELSCLQNSAQRIYFMFLYSCYDESLIIQTTERFTNNLIFTSSLGRQYSTIFNTKVIEMQCTKRF